MRVLLDTNIILDFFLEREPFFQDFQAATIPVMSAAQIMKQLKSN